MKKKERPKLNLDDSFSSIAELKPWLLFIKENFKFYGKPKHEEKWLDVPCSFDIEQLHSEMKKVKNALPCIYGWQAFSERLSLVEHGLNSIPFLMSVWKSWN